MGRKRALPAEGQSIEYNTIKVRLHPTAAQAELFEKTFGCCRYIWNRMLLDQERFYLETGKHFLPTPAKYKKEAPFLTEVDHQTLTQEYNQLAQAFRLFFKKPETFRHPRLKRKKDDRDSFCACNQFWSGGSTIYITRDAIRMTKAGFVKASFPRRPRSGWRLTRISVEKTRTGKYYGYLLYECPVHTPKPIVPSGETTVALRTSRTHFFTTDCGEIVDLPAAMRKTEEKIARIQKKLARMNVGSQNYRDAVQSYRRLNEHLVNQRKDFIHKQSRRIANEWDAVCVRDDALLQMRGTNSTGLRIFRETLRYKLERQGKSLLVVDRYCPTTKTCAQCGCINDALDGNADLWRCPHCGATLRRDLNAAQNIKTMGLRTRSA